MATILTDEVRTARKDYHCDACSCIFESDAISYLSFSELRIMVKAKMNGYKILKGQKYIYQSGIYDGAFYVFRGIPEVLQIYFNHDLHEE